MSGKISATIPQRSTRDITSTACKLPASRGLGGSVIQCRRIIFSVPNFYGAHGHAPILESMSASFYAAGPNIRGGFVIPKMQNVDVAPTIMSILGVPPSDTVDGHVLKVILK